MDEQVDLIARVEALESRIQQLSAENAALRASFGEVPAQQGPPTSHEDTSPAQSPGPGGPDAPLDRRHVLGKAALAAAAGLAGGTAAALGDAMPAAAAAGSFDTAAAGTPAVTATVNGGVAAAALRANPGAAGTGLKVLGSTSGYGVDAMNSSSAATGSFINLGTGAAVDGYSYAGFLLLDVNPLAAVTGRNLAGTGAAAGVFGSAKAAPFGWGVVGHGTYVGVGGYGSTYDFRAVGSSTIGFEDPVFEHGPEGTEVSNSRGWLCRDHNGDLWYCITSGRPSGTGRWRKVSGPDAAGSLHLLSTPKRVYDSRVGGQTPLDSGERAVNVTTVGPGLPGAGSASGVPAGAVAVLANLTATNTVLVGWLAMWANGLPWPGHSNLNWSTSGTNIANQCTSNLAGGSVKVKSAGKADFIVDVFGYYR